MTNSVLLIRADASVQIGTGHVMRCLALAQAWTDAGGRAVFLHAAVTPSIERRIEGEGFEHLSLDVEVGSPRDAALSGEIARRFSAAWVVADGYEFNAAWQRAIRAQGLRLLLLDDFGHADGYDAEIVLNQNTSSRELSYMSRGADTRLLLGSRFALLRREFLDPFPRESGTSAALRILVTLGGSDTHNATGAVVAALAALPDLDVTVVAGGSNPHLMDLERQVSAAGSSFRLVVDTKEMPRLLARADAAISASGSTVWELAHAGVPTALIVTADNQVAIAEALAEAGAALPLGRHPGLTAEALRASLSQWLYDSEARTAMGTRAAQLIDGHGARRVSAALGRSLAITFLSDKDSWLNPTVATLANSLGERGHAVQRIHRPEELRSGDVAFLLSLSRVVPPALLRRHAHNLVVHESAVPHGRGWSPLTWQVLEGRTEIPVSLMEAADGVDSGAVYSRRTIHLRGNELIDELRAAQAEATCDLCLNFLARYPYVCAEAVAQTGTPTYYPRRRPADSRLDPERSIAQQFNLLRVCDPDRYPAFFDYAGRRFELRITASR